MTKISLPIRFIPSLDKSIDWSKEWIKHYEPKVSKSDIEYIFEDKKFVKKYSTKPSETLSSKEILKEAQTDIKDYSTKVEKRIKDLELDDEKKILKKVDQDLPSAEELTQILMSYRLYDTIGKSRIRVPINLEINMNDIDIKQLKKNKNNKA